LYIPFALKGVDFLDAVRLVSQRKYWTSNAFKTECRKWFSLLLKVVDIKKGVENTFGSFLESGKAVTLDKNYRPHIETEVCIIYVYIFQWTEFARGIIESLLPLWVVSLVARQVRSLQVCTTFCGKFLYLLVHFQLTN